MQLDEADRGFAYAQDAPLDMRMDQHRRSPRPTCVNTYPPRRPGPDPARLRRGEVRPADRRGRSCASASSEPFTTSARLAELVRDAIPAAATRTGGHPAKRTFQALRIEVNGELEVLRRALPAALDALALGGRIVVLSYHSLEDRIVKQAFAAAHARATYRTTCR